jgi:hypothetical protein
MESIGLTLPFAACCLNALAQPLPPLVRQAAPAFKRVAWT